MLSHYKCGYDYTDGATNPKVEIVETGHLNSDTEIEVVMLGQL